MNVMVTEGAKKKERQTPASPKRKLLEQVYMHGLRF